MSFDALSWAAKCNPKSSARKLVLLALAECAQRETCQAFPSVAAIAEFTCLNRKTIIGALADLEAMKFITDTGEKTGRTGQIKVYHLNLETVPKTVPLKSTEIGTVPKTVLLEPKKKSVEKQNVKRVPKSEQFRKRDTEPVYSTNISNSKRAKSVPAIAKPKGVTAQTWDDFLAHRKTKRSPVTATVMVGIEREAKKAGWSIEDALIETVSRGWQGFKADWVESSQPANDGGGFLATFQKRQANGS